MVSYDLWVNFIPPVSGSITLNPSSDEIIPVFSDTADIGQFGNANVSGTFLVGGHTLTFTYVSSASGPINLYSGFITIIEVQ